MTELKKVKYWNHGKGGIKEKKLYCKLHQFLELREVSDPYPGKETKTTFQKDFRRKGLTFMTGDMNIIICVNLIIFEFSGRTQQPEFSVLVMKIHHVYYSCSETVSIE